MQTIIYEYGARLDKDCRMATEAQFAKARQLYNQIIEIVQACRAEADRYLREREPQIAALNAEVDELNARFDAAKALNAEPAMAEVAALRRAAWQRMTPLMRAARKAHRDVLAAIFAPIGLRKACATYQARCAAVAGGLGSATADDVHAAALKAWDKVRKDGGRLRYRSARERTQDHIINRFTMAGGVEMDKLLTCDHPMIGLKAPAEIKKRRYGEFRFRLGNATAHQAATGTWQCHRPFPAGARVTTVRLVRRKTGPEISFALQFQLAVAQVPAVERAAELGLCAIHLGFSLADSGRVRIGAIADHADPGFARPIELIEAIGQDLTRVEHLNARRAQDRDAIHEHLVAAVVSERTTELAEEWGALARLPAQRCAIARIKQLSRRIEDLHLEEHTPLAARLKAYTIADHWLYSQERHLHKKALNRRKNQYRKLAIDLAKTYRVIAIGRYDLAAMARRIDTDGERNGLGQIARRSRHLAALYQLVDCLRWACLRAGAVLIEDEALDYAGHCAGCGAENPHEGDLYRCDCGLEADAKANAAASLFARWTERAAARAEEIKARAAAAAAEAERKKHERLTRMQDRRRLAAEG